MGLPTEVYLQESSIYCESFLRGIESVIISYGAKFDVTPTARANSDNLGSLMLKSLTILNGGVFHQSSPKPIPTILDMYGPLTITAGGVMNVSAAYIGASDVFIDGGAILTAGKRGYPCGEGKEPGKSSTTSASGAGHGGAGGRGSQTVVGKAYGQFDKPLDPGSGGGQGYRNLVCSCDHFSYF